MQQNVGDKTKPCTLPTSLCRDGQEMAATMTAQRNQSIKDMSWVLMGLHEVDAFSRAELFHKSLPAYRALSLSPMVLAWEHFFLLSQAILALYSILIAKICEITTLEELSSITAVSSGFSSVVHRCGYFCYILDLQASYLAI